VELESNFKELKLFEIQEKVQNQSTLQLYHTQERDIDTERVIFTLMRVIFTLVRVVFTRCVFNNFTTM
jgi:hypothetical protein